MATWVNLMDVIYPVGSVYLSINSTSPSSTIGGTWTQIKGAVLAAYGANSFASSGKYGGSLKISVSQMPSHNHIYVDGGGFTVTAGNAATAVQWGNWNNLKTDIVTGTTGGGGQTSCPIITPFIFGDELPRYCKVGDINAYSC